MRKFDLSLRSSRSSYFATFRHQLTSLSKTDALHEEKWLNMLGTFVKDWFRWESHVVPGRDPLVDIPRARGVGSDADAGAPLMVSEQWVSLQTKQYGASPCGRRSLRRGRTPARETRACRRATNGRAGRHGSSWRR